MHSVRQIAEDIVQREGGFVNDPDDPGGATNFGVTIGTMRRLGVDVDQDGDVDINDVRRLTRPQAVDIFIRHYFEKPGIADLPGGVQASVFDMYVNAGSHAVRILQSLLNDMGASLAVDGQLGPATKAAADQAMQAAPHHFVDAYGIARRNYYYRLADKRPKSRKYAKRRDGGKGGWIRRAEEFMAEKYHFSSADHRKRTASWA